MHSHNSPKPNKTGISALCCAHIVEFQAVHKKANLNDDIFIITKPEVKILHCPEGMTELLVVEDEKILISPSQARSRRIDVHIERLQAHEA
ncbi:hypothetical protein E4U59_002169 [Claviceps monticola]|nr:hypothetical protein E4U59_002169 [Claviceps monticola]